MKKITEIILKNEKIFVGLEDSKRTWKLCVRNNNMIVFQGSIPAEFENLMQFFKNKFPKCLIKVIYEAGFSGFWLHDRLQEKGINCIVTPPNMVTEEKCNKVKTDKIDARRLAKVLENEDFKACRVPSEERMQHRQLSRTLHQVQKKITSTKNQIRRFFDVHGIITPKGVWSDKTYIELRNIVIHATLQYCLDMYLDMLDLLRNQKQALTKKLKELAKSPAYNKTVKLYQSTPGIGEFTAIRLALEWGDISEFSSGKKFASYNGLCPSEYSTGDTVKRGGITKQGNRLARHWLVEAAWTAIKKDPALLEKFNAVWKSSGKKNVAIVAVARKLAVRLRGLVLSDKPYVLGLIEG
ncbi:MAG: IS110 family transposase [Fibrobacteria bacterium]|nr:IS110 family transposase [Fibrobacteria bacterium]